MIQEARVSKLNSNVQIIPATIEGVKCEPLRARKELRVAAYCRVSTGNESQQTSYTTQKSYYANWIHSHPGWKFAGIYADEGISGTSTKNRVQFQQMMQDARDGKIDYIVTKSISRFARNTITAIECVRELQGLVPKVGVYFEKENVDTLEQSGEMALTLYANMAQEESHSISTNIRWSLQKNFEAGVEHINLDKFIGYDRGEKGEWVINEEQAAIVRTIFARYAMGVSANQIAIDLNEAGKFTVNGKKWSASSILRVLKNEKYIGDIEMQKTYTKDFLSHTSLINNGELAKYYTKNHHVAIIDKMLWDKVQLRLAGKAEKKRVRIENKKRGKPSALFLNLTFNGSQLHRMTYSTVASGYSDERSEGFDKYNETESYHFAEPCWKVLAEDGGSPVFHECALKQSFMEKLYEMKRDYEANGKNSAIWKSYMALSKEDRVEDAELGGLRDKVDKIKAAIEENIIKQAKAMTDIALETNADLADAVEEGSITSANIYDDIIYGLRNSEEETFYHVEIPEDSDAATYAEIVRDLKSNLIGLEKRIDTITTANITEEEKVHDFDYFLRCLTALPEQNLAGMQIVVNGLDVDGSILRDADGEVKDGKLSALRKGHLRVTPEIVLETPDYLTFDETIYRNFIKEGKLEGDKAIYTTTFGVTFETAGNKRTLSSFLGFRRSKDDGTIELLSENYKVANAKVTYTRRAK